MSNVTKQELCSQITKATNISVTEVRLVIENFFSLISDHLEKNERLEIRGFGSLYMKHRKPKLVRNPKRPEDTKTLPERWAPVLRFSKDLKAAINRPHAALVENKGDFHFVMVFRDFVDTEIEQVNDTIEGLLSQGITHIATDFSTVRYIYSPGLSGLIRFNRLCKEAGGQFYVVNVKPSVMNKIESVNLDKALSVYTTKEQLLAQGR
jgi:integration host factor subunit beta